MITLLKSILCNTFHSYDKKDESEMNIWTGIIIVTLLSYSLVRFRLRECVVPQQMEVETIYGDNRRVEDRKHDIRYTVPRDVSKSRWRHHALERVIEQHLGLHECMNTGGYDSMELFEAVM